MTIWLGRVVSPLTLLRVIMIISVLFIILGLGHILSRIIPTWHKWLVHVVHSRVGVIQVKWGQGEIWIHINIEKIVVVKIYFTIYKKNKQTNKQRKKKEKENRKQAYARVDLDLDLSLIHIWRCRRSTLCRSRWSPYH